MVLRRVQAAEADGNAKKLKKLDAKKAALDTQLEKITSATPTKITIKHAMDILKLQASARHLGQSCLHQTLSVTVSLSLSLSLSVCLCLSVCVCVCLCVCVFMSVSLFLSAPPAAPPPPSPTHPLTPLPPRCLTNEGLCVEVFPILNWFTKTR